MKELRVIQYRSGSRCVVVALEVDTAGSEVMFGPASRDECEAYVTRQVCGGDGYGVPGPYRRWIAAAAFVPVPWPQATDRGAILFHAIRAWAATKGLVI